MKGQQNSRDLLASKEHLSKCTAVNHDTTFHMFDVGHFFINRGCKNPPKDSLVNLNIYFLTENIHIQVHIFNVTVFSMINLRFMFETIVCAWILDVCGISLSALTKIFMTSLFLWLWRMAHFCGCSNILQIEIEYLTWLHLRQPFFSNQTLHCFHIEFHFSLSRRGNLNQMLSDHP